MKGRIVEPEEIAGVAYLMTLDEASAVNATGNGSDDILRSKELTGTAFITE